MDPSPDPCHLELHCSYSLCSVAFTQCDYQHPDSTLAPVLVKNLSRLPIR